MDRLLTSNGSGGGGGGLSVDVLGAAHPLRPHGCGSATNVMADFIQSFALTASGGCGGLACCVWGAHLCLLGCPCVLADCTHPLRLRAAVAPTYPRAVSTY